MNKKIEIEVLVSGICNESHLIYVASYIDSLKNSFLIKKTRVIVGKPFLFNKKISKSDIEYWLNDFELIEKIQVNEKIIPSLLCSGKKIPLYYICIGSINIISWLRLKLHYPFRKIINVVVDEGLGSYSNISSMMALFKREKGYNKFFCFLFSFYVFYVKKRFLLDHMWSLYLKNMSVNKEIVKFIINKNRINITNNGCYILLLSQPWVELNLLTRNEYLKLIGDIKNIVESKNITLLIKTHPAENIEKYDGMNMFLYNGKRPIEIEFDYIHCKGLIGFNSTALLTINAVYGVNTAKLNVEKLNTVLLSPFQEELFNKYTTEIKDIKQLPKWISSLV